MSEPVFTASYDTRGRMTGVTADPWPVDRIAVTLQTLQAWNWDGGSEYLSTRTTEHEGKRFVTEMTLLGELFRVVGCAKGMVLFERITGTMDGPQETPEGT